MKLWNDERAGEDKLTHRVLVAGRDRFLGAWGPGKECGGSTAVWACTLNDYELVLEWVRSRGDMSHVRLTNEKALKRVSGIVHIYTVNDHHPAVSGRGKS